MSGGEKMRKLLCAFFVLTLALGLASSGWGQSQITAGTVQGDVLDEKGGSVAGATVEAKNLATNFVQTDTTNTDGHFAFLSLASGRYTLTISADTLGEVTNVVTNATGINVEHTVSDVASGNVSAVASNAGPSYSRQNSSVCPNSGWPRNASRMSRFRPMWWKK